MTQFAPQEIECKCGYKVKIDIYESVNVTVDPKLNPKVLKRQINTFSCPVCGRYEELVSSFLFTDNKKNLWIWTFPEHLLKDKEELIDSSKGFIASVKMAEALRIKVNQAFGYDELLTLIAPGFKSDVIKSKNMDKFTELFVEYPDSATWPALKQSRRQFYHYICSVMEDAFQNKIKSLEDEELMPLKIYLQMWDTLYGKEDNFMNLLQALDNYMHGKVIEKIPQYTI